MALLVGRKRDFSKSNALENSVSILFVVFCAVIQYNVAAKVPDPFIDEIFHLRQCQTYCEGRFGHWDNKITTPPGLYVLGYIYSKKLQYITKDNVCASYSVLRSLNLVGGILVFPLALRAIRKMSPNQFWSVNIVSQPLLFTYYFLFYTDIWSTLFIVVSLSLVIQKPASPYLSGFFGFVSLWFRQTNIVWIGFILAVLVDRQIDTRDNQSAPFIVRLQKFVYTFFKNWTQVLPFLLNVVLFMVFLVVNGGITFGDKENHEIKAHLVQVFYCFVFIAFFTWPVWLSKSTAIEYGKFWLKWRGANLILNGLSLAIIKLIIENFTIVHPFLLADNRHFTFYIFKKLISHRHSIYVTVPLYHFCTWNLIHTLNQSTRLGLSPITVLAFVAAIILTIVPSPLFEPRYYIVPLILYRLYIKPKSKVRHMVEFAWLNIVNLATMAVFFNYEFIWPSEPDIIQRIIW